MRGLIWFKKDLRIGDQTALHQACQSCEKGVVGVYIIDKSMWHDHHTAPCQIDFIFRGLQSLQADLKQISIPLLIVEVTATSEIPTTLIQIAKQHHLDTLFFNREYEINEQKRDTNVTHLFSKEGLAVKAFDDQCILPISLLKRDNGDYFKVFTPFKRHWLKLLHSHGQINLLAKPTVTNPINLDPPIFSSPAATSTVDPALWPAGESHARSRLKAFISNSADQYDTQRDFPAKDDTSRLSPYLALGMISPRECFRAALLKNQYELDSGNKGLLTWMSELIWRDFYRIILISAPHVCMNKAYKRQTDQLAWKYDAGLLQAWQQGQTGFPLVDAAMRQLNTIGWMHNRLRMVTAMFLSKNLFLDWRLGENYFAEHLIDFDFASNNGGWQWSASTGTDAVPYFRIFNPTTQSERFDPNGDFIRQYCPELKAFDSKRIHDPYAKDAALAEKSGYPRPIIDYKKSREHVLSVFKGLG